MKKSLKEMSRILAAAAEGKTIQARFLVGDSEWVNVDTFGYFDWNTYEYRIRPQSETTPLDREDLDAIATSGGSMWIKESAGSKRHMILRYTSIGVTISDSSSFKDVTYKELQNKYTWMDGSLIQKQSIA